jgi:ubiquinone/menaquinone biosynthesis C-methylase UbiE
VSARKETPPTGAGAGRIDADYYNRTTYFDAAPHLLDRESRFQQYRVRMVRELAQPRPTDVVVDLGCGWGTFEFALAPQVRHITGVDFSSRSIDFCEAELVGSGQGNVSFLCADAGDTGMEAASVDLVVAADLYEHLYPEDSARITREAFRILRPGGRFAIWTPHRGHILEILKNNGILLKPDPTHVDYKSMDRLLGELGRTGFEIGRASYAESHLPGLSLLERWLGWATPLLRRRIAILAIKP